MNYDNYDKQEDDNFNTISRNTQNSPEFTIQILRDEL